MKKFVVCSTDDYGNLTIYRSYEVIDEDSDKIKIIDDFGVVIWVEKFLFKNA